MIGSNCLNQTEDEISVAAYEALVYILKDLASVFSLSLDLLMKTDSSSPSDADREPVLDTFLSTFIGNINNLVAGGNLARTRRAILMNWKVIQFTLWCNACLLSFLFCNL